jgi:hypothetical protein
VKYLPYIDERGYRRRVLVRDGETDPANGVVQKDIDLDALDWDAIKHNLHTMLYDRNLLTLEDVQQHQEIFIQCIVTALKKPLLRMYQQE